jgi:hypothetical protein
MILLIEATKTRVESIGKKLYLTGIMAEAETPNRNSRIYRLPTLQRECHKLQEQIRGKASFCELGHSQVGEATLERCAGLLESLTQSGNSFVGRIKILETPMGNIVRKLIHGGATLGASTKGFGSVKKNAQGVDEVADDYSMKQIDIVGEPSAIHATMKAVHECVSKMPLNEAYLGMEALRRLGQGLVHQQLKNGTDWDNREGNMYPGHDGFPSCRDLRLATMTALERSDEDTLRIIAKLLGLQADIGVDNEGLERDSVRLAKSTRDPIANAIANKEKWMAKNNEIMRQRALELLRRLSKYNG